MATSDVSDETTSTTSSLTDLSPVEQDDNNPLGDSDEISTNTSDLEPGGPRFEIQPFNFADYPDKVRHNILRHLLVSDELIKPYWNLGALQVAAQNAEKENFPTLIVAFAGHQTLIDEATTILYGENVFELQSATISLWWLKRIGSNRSKLRNLIVSVQGGVLDRGYGTRFEKIWFQIFVLLEAGHNLRALDISFAEWTHEVDGADGLDPATADDVWEPRQGLLKSLLSFRGLEGVTITPGPWMVDDCADLLASALLMPKGKTNAAIISFDAYLENPKRGNVPISDIRKDETYDAVDAVLPEPKRANMPISKIPKEETHDAVDADLPESKRANVPILKIPKALTYDAFDAFLQEPQ